MCFAPQRRALFQHLNFQKWSERGVFCTFWLGNVLRATMACNFCISPLASWLRTRRFSEPTFRPSGASNHWKNAVLRDCPTFSRICICFLLTLSLLLFSLLMFLFSLPLPCSAFHLSILSEVWLLNFLRLYIYIIICVCVISKCDILRNLCFLQRCRIVSSRPLDVAPRAASGNTSPCWRWKPSSARLDIWSISLPQTDVERLPKKWLDAEKV